MKKFKRKGQSTLEYAVVIAVIVAGILAVQNYMNRGIQGRLRQSANDIGDQYSLGHATSSTTTTYETQVGADGFGIPVGGVVDPAAVAPVLQGASWSSVSQAGQVTQRTEKKNDTLASETLFE
jgi:hypothetical protein